MSKSSPTALVKCCNTNRTNDSQVTYLEIRREHSAIEIKNTKENIT